MTRDGLLLLVLLASLAAPAMAQTASHAISVGGGSYGFEVGWSISCADSSTLSGGAPYGPTTFTATLDTTCTITMTDSYGDGWNGNSLSGINDLTFTLASGSPKPSITHT